MNTQTSTPKNNVVMVKFAPLTLRKDYGDGDYGILNYATRNGYPRITVFTTNKNKEEVFDYNTMINATFNLTQFLMFVDEIRDIVEADKDTSASVDCFNAKYVNGVKTNDVELQATAIVGKDKDGIIYLAVTHEGKRKIKFELLPTEWNKYSRNKEALSKEELSKRFTKAYIRAIDLLFGIAGGKGGNVKIVESQKGITRVADKSSNIDTSDINEDDLF